MSDLLSQASLVMIPSGYKEDTVYSVVPSDGSGDLSFTRASNGTRVNSAGLVEVCPWNLYTYSEIFSNSIWASGNATITSDTTTAPNGTVTADSMFEQAVNDYQIRGQNYSMVSGQTFTFSIYAKANTRNFFRILVGNGVLVSDKYAYFDLVNVTTTSTSLITSSIESVGNGWCKIVISFTCNSTGTDAIYFGSSPNMTSGYLPFVGNASNGVYIWGAQLNIGSTAKPYFPTTDRLNVPRLTYQNGGGGCPSLLLEKQSTNLMYPSEDFTNINWAPSNLTITANDATSPDGTQNADKFTSTSTTIENQVRFGSFAILSNVGSSYTVSVFAKKGTADFLRIRNLFTQDGATSGNAWFNLSTGAVGTVQSSQTASMQNMGNGWYRCVLTGVVGATNTYDFVDIGFTNTDGANFPTTSVNGYVYGAQLEASSYPTSYIVSTSSSATRVADACFKTSATALIGQTEGTMFGEIEVILGITNMVGWMRKLSSGVYADDILAYVSSAGLPNAGADVGGVNQVSIAGTSPLTAGYHKIAFAYKQNDFVLYVDGVQIGTDTSGSVPTCDEVYIDQYIDGGSRNATKKQFVLFKTRLTNAQLASLTTI